MENRKCVGMNKTKIVAASIFALLVASASISRSERNKRTRVAYGVGRSLHEGAARRGENSMPHCSSCHGPDLAGNDEAAPLVGSAFLANWDGLSVGD